MHCVNQFRITRMKYQIEFYFPSIVYYVGRYFSSTYYLTYRCCIVCGLHTNTCRICNVDIEITFAFLGKYKCKMCNVLRLFNWLVLIPHLNLLLLPSSTFTIFFSLIMGSVRPISFFLYRPIPIKYRYNNFHIGRYRYR